MKFEILGEKIVFEKYGKKVIEQNIKLPNGQQNDFVMWGGKSIPSIIFALTSDNKVIAIKQLRIAASVEEKKETWVLECPGGNASSNESAETTARRELLEETGYEAEKIIPFQKIWIDPSTCLTPFIPLFAQNCKKIKEPKLGKTEILELVHYPLKEWVELIENGTINDSKTITTTLLALLKIGYLKI